MRNKRGTIRVGMLPKMWEELKDGKAWKEAVFAFVHRRQL
jgi:hypothetical protein